MRKARFSRSTMSKSVLLILAITGFARVAIFAIPVAGIYLGVNSNTTQQAQ